MFKWLFQMFSSAPATSSPITKGKIVTKYTDAMVDELKSMDELTYDGARAFATQHNLPVRSVIAKARALEVDYIPKQATKAARRENARMKKEIVASVNGLLGANLTSLNKLTVADLEQIEMVLQAR